MTDTETGTESVPVLIVGDVREKQYGADFGSWQNYDVSVIPLRILPRRQNRERALIWISSTPDAGTGVLLASSYENAQAGVGGLLTAQGQTVEAMAQQDVWAILSGAGADISLSVHDETWRAND